MGFWHQVSLGSVMDKEVTQQQECSAKNKQHVVYSFFGPPGSGKGTVAREAVQKLGFKTLSTGDLLRAEIAAETELGAIAKRHISDGQLVPDELVTELVFNHLKTLQSDSVILDGYPRTVKQAQELVAMLAEENLSLRVVRFVLSDEEIVRRLSVRLVCSDKKCQAIYSTSSKPPRVAHQCDLCAASLMQRQDDACEVVKKRLQEYEQYARPLLDYYLKAHIALYDLDLTGLDIEAVFKKFSDLYTC